MIEFAAGFLVAAGVVALSHIRVPMWADKNSSFSHAKFWSTVAYATFTWVVIKLTLDKLNSWEMMLAYAAVVGGSELAKKFMTMWFERKGN